MRIKTAGTKQDREERENPTRNYANVGLDYIGNAASGRCAKAFSCARSCDAATTHYSR